MSNYPSSSLYDVITIAKSNTKHNTQNDTQNDKLNNTRNTIKNATISDDIKASDSDRKSVFHGHNFGFVNVYRANDCYIENEEDNSGYQDEVNLDNIYNELIDWGNIRIIILIVIVICLGY